MATFSTIPLPKWLEHQPPKRRRTRNPHIVAAVYLRISLVQLVAVVEELLTAPTAATRDDLALVLVAAKSALADPIPEPA